MFKNGYNSCWVGVFFIITIFKNQSTYCISMMILFNAPTEAVDSITVQWISQTAGAPADTDVNTWGCFQSHDTSHSPSSTWERTWRTLKHTQLRVALHELWAVVRLRCVHIETISAHTLPLESRRTGGKEGGREGNEAGRRGNDWRSTGRVKWIHIEIFRNGKKNMWNVGFS